MKSNQLIGAIAIGIILPSIAIASVPAIAGEIRVKTANVEAVSRRNGSIYVNTGGNTVSLNRRRAYRSWSPWQNWNFPWQRHRASGCRHGSYQSTRQTTRSSSGTIYSSSSTQICN
ncbi:MAG: hypothetical protein AAFQ80_19390 [Cyanobacteria bacterium J06621_8]